MSLDLSQDYLVFDDPITLTLMRKTGEGEYTAIEVEYCQRGALNKEYQSVQDAQLEVDTASFHLWTDNLQGFVPKLDDKIVVDGTTEVYYLVKEVAEADVDANGVQRYVCYCHRIDE